MLARAKQTDQQLGVFASSEHHVGYLLEVSQYGRDVIKIQMSSLQDTLAGRGRRRKAGTKEGGALGCANKGQVAGQGSPPSLYHCNYCAKDISSVPRIKCAVCKDFDLCLECFSVGVEITPHKNHHDYQVVENLSFPLYHPDWGVSFASKAPCCFHSSAWDAHQARQKGS